MEKISTTTGFTLCDFKELSKQLSQSMSTREHPEDRFSTNLIIPSANSLKVLTVVTASWESIVAEKSKISASFLRVNVKEAVGSKIFNDCNLLLWYSSCFFRKSFGETNHFYFENLGTKRRTK